MPELTILDTQILTHPNTGITSKYVRAKIDDFEFECPYLTSNLSDYKKSHSTNIALGSEIFQYYIDQTSHNSKPLTDMTKRSSIKNTFNKILELKKPKITGINFYYDSHFVDERTRQLSLEIQTELNTTFLSDLEPDRNQSPFEFETQLEHFLGIETDQIKCPTISLRTLDSGVFEEKINLIFTKGFKAFNVEWGGVSQYKQNMLILSRKLADTKILCNFVSTKPIRRYHKPYESNLIFAGLLGASLISPGFVKPAGKLPELLPPGKLFDSSTWNYSESPGQRDILHVTSMNSIFNTLYEIGVNIRDGISSDQLIPSEFTLID